MSSVFMSPGFNTSIVGHVAERYIYCLDNKLMDLLFDYSQLTSLEAWWMKLDVSKNDKHADGHGIGGV